MFKHIFKYTLLGNIRSKDQIFWILCFPMILGTLFHVAFGNIHNTEILFQSVPVAIIYNIENPAFETTVEHITDSDSPLFTVMTTNKEEAASMLKNQEITGIIYVDKAPFICFNSNDKGSPIEQSILNTFLNEYIAMEQIITEVATNNPAKLLDVLAQMEKNIEINEEISYSNGTKDTFVQYFYNLIAMVSLYCSIAGCTVVISNQGNLSAEGARKSVSSIPRFLSILAELLATALVQVVCILISLCYLVLILKVDFGDNLPLVVLTCIISAIFGVSFGFFIGSFGKLGQSMKIGVLMAVSMACSFLSGLMMDQMREIINGFCPIINKINPAALISDSFYALNVYETYDRYIQNISTIILYTCVFIIFGFLMNRRKKYASI